MGITTLHSVRHMGHRRVVIMTLSPHESQMQRWPHGTKTCDLGALRQSRRKAIRQERRKVRDAGIKVTRLRGHEIKAHHWEALHRFYCHTVEEKLKALLVV